MTPGFLLNVVSLFFEAFLSGLLFKCTGVIALPYINLPAYDTYDTKGIHTEEKG